MLQLAPEILGTASFPNITASGPIGTAAATVDLYSSIAITQSTSNLVLTIPAPTAAPVWGLQFVIHNIGTVGVAIQGLYIRPGCRGTYTWANTQWIAETDSQVAYPARVTASGEANIWPANQQIFGANNTVPPLGSATPVNKIPATVQALRLADGDWAATLILPDLTATSQPITIHNTASSATTIQPQGSTMGSGLRLGTGEYARFVPTSTGWQWVPPRATGTPGILEHHRITTGDAPVISTFNGRTYSAGAGWIPYISGDRVNAPNMGTAHGANFRINSAGNWELYADVVGQTAETWRFDLVFQLIYGVQVTRYGTFN